MSDDDYVEAIGTDTSEDAVEPNQGADDHANPEDAFEAGAPETRTRVAIPRGTAADRKAMSEAIARFAAERGDGEEDHGDFGDYDEKPTPRPQPKPKAPPLAGQPQPAATAPPAPSLDPEVSRARQLAQQEREAAEQARRDAEQAREKIGAAGDYEVYLESAPKAFRTWLETMRGEKMTDDEYRQESADFVTLMSGDVLGVKLPDEVKSRIEAQLARKAVSAYRSKDSKRQMAETNRRETERVQAEWDNAKQSLDRHFSSDEATQKEFPWLAATDSPGLIVVDLIQSAKRRDGTVLDWREASKQANDYLKKDASRWIDKRKHLLSAAPTSTVGDPAKGKQVASTGRPPGPSQVTRTETPPAESAYPVNSRNKPGSQWDKEAHRRETRRAFAPLFTPEE